MPLSPRAAVWIALLIPASVSCGLSSVTAPDLMEATKTGDAFEGTQCSAIRPPTEPDLMGWDSGSRLKLKQLQENGVVGVRYKAEGCNVELEVLNCVGKGAEYKFSPYSATETKVAKSQRDLFMDLPIGAARLGGKVGGGRALRTDYMLAGVLATPVMKAFPGDKLEGDCDRATHVVSSVYIGGFAMVAGESETLSAQASIFGVGAGASQDRTAERLATEGNAKSCEKAQTESTREPACSVPLRIGLTPVEGRAEGSCPSGSTWDGKQCVLNQVVTKIWCPAGTTLSGTRCLANASKNCPASMVSIPGGTFTMRGRGDTVTVGAYCLDLTEVTVAAVTACAKGACSAEGAGTQFSRDTDVGKGACNWGVSGREGHPMNCVDWGHAAGFCRAQGKRLPTEEEWEWAARGGSEQTTYSFGNVEPASQVCWSGVAKRSGTCAVGSFPDSHGRFGLQDMAGNVWEWTSSRYDADTLVLRGGGWATDDPMDLQSANRSRLAPSDHGDTFGFRCAK